jgi:hypothetical protein
MAARLLVLVESLGALEGRPAEVGPGALSRAVPRGGRIDAQDLSKERIEVLAIPLGVVGDAAVSGADVEHLVGPEEDQAAVVIRGEVLHHEDVALARGVDGSVPRHGEADDPLVLVGVGVVGEECARGLEVGCERNGQQSLLAAVGDLLRDVERGGRLTAGRDPLDPARLLDHQEVLAAGLLGDEHRLVKVADLLEARVPCGLFCRRRLSGRCGCGVRAAVALIIIAPARCNQPDRSRGKNRRRCPPESHGPHLTDPGSRLG